MLAESLRVAHEASALRSQDLKRVAVDAALRTKVHHLQADAHRNRGGSTVWRAARGQATAVLSPHCQDRGNDGRRHAYVKQFKRQLRILRSGLGRIIRDICRKMKLRLSSITRAPPAPPGLADPLSAAAPAWLEALLLPPLSEVECIGKGKTAAPYEFGEGLHRHQQPPASWGVFVLHARALPDNQYDGYTLRDVIDRTETLTGCAVEWAYVEKDTAATTHKIPAESSSLTRSAAPSVPSSASAAPLSNPSSDT